MSFKTLMCASFLVFLPIGPINVGPDHGVQKKLKVTTPIHSEKVSKNASVSDSAAVIPDEFKQYEPDTKPLKDMLHKVDSLAKASEKTFKDNNIPVK